MVRMNLFFWTKINMVYFNSALKVIIKKKGKINGSTSFFLNKQSSFKTVI